MTCLPACIASTIIDVCKLGGVQMSTTSSSPSAIKSRKLRYALGIWCRRAKSRTWSPLAATALTSTFRRVYGMNVDVKAVAARGDHVLDFARRHQIPRAYRSFRDLIADGELDVVDICTPPNLHASMIVETMQAGKHVICEKPFAGYFGREGDKAPIGKHVPKALMYERVLEEMESTRAAIGKTGRLFMYAEDWIYAPAVTKTVEILKATKDKILFMKGEESHSGSHAAHAAQWAMTGGGSLIRMGCHPLAAVLYLKQVEAKARGEA